MLFENGKNGGQNLLDCEGNCGGFIDVRLLLFGKRLNYLFTEVNDGTIESLNATALSVKWKMNLN